MARLPKGVTEAAIKQYTDRGYSRVDAIFLAEKYCSIPWPKEKEGAVKSGKRGKI